MSKIKVSTYVTYVIYKQTWINLHQGTPYISVAQRPCEQVTNKKQNFFAGDKRIYFHNSLSLRHNSPLMHTPASGGSAKRF